MFTKKKKQDRRGSKGVKSYIFPDGAGYMSPVSEEMFDMFGDLMYFDAYQESNGSVSARYADDYCDDDFDTYDWEEVMGWPDRAMDYMRDHGALVVPVDNRCAFVAGHDEIVARFGRDTPETRKEALEELGRSAEIFRMWADGDIYAYSVRDVEGVPDSPEPEYIWNGYDDVPDGEVLDEMYGFYGQDAVEEEALATWKYEMSKRAKGSANRRKPVKTKGRKSRGCRSDLVKAAVGDVVWTSQNGIWSVSVVRKGMNGASPTVAVSDGGKGRRFTFKLASNGRVTSDDSAKEVPDYVRRAVDPILRQMRDNARGGCR